MVETIQDIYFLLSRPYALLILAFTLDLCIGDPGWLPHPVRVMGKAITNIEGLLRKCLEQTGDTERKSQNTETKERWAGMLLVVIMTGSTFALFYTVSSVLLTLHFLLFTSYFSLLVMVYLISTTLAAKELIDSARCVIEAFKNRSIESARKNLRHIVGRDTDSLNEKGVLRATIESLAENASDGIIAPLFYFAIGGLPLAMTYKAINTMDSMVGYKNKKYRHFGWAAARLDDIVNYIPARITGMLVVIATFMLNISEVLKSSRLFKIVHPHPNPPPSRGREFNNLTLKSSPSPGGRGLGGGGTELLLQLNFPDCLNALKVMLRDGRKHTSPNSGVPEAAMAGALGVMLGGPSTYGGIVVEKPYIGEERQSTEHRTQSTDNRAQNTEDLYLKASKKAIIIVKLTSIIGLGFAIIFQYLRITLL